MNPRAAAHLAVAREFLATAAAAARSGHNNAAYSNAVLAGVNAKDAICIARLGGTTKSQRHDDAVAELKSAGRDASALAPVLKRLLSRKSQAQYSGAAISPPDAANAVGWAERLIDLAIEVVR